MLAAAVSSAGVVGAGGWIVSSAVTSTLTFHPIEKLTLPAPFTEPSFESTSPMKFAMVFWAVAGGVGGVVVPSVVSVEVEVEVGVEAGSVVVAAAPVGGVVPVESVFDVDGLLAGTVDPLVDGAAGGCVVGAGAGRAAPAELHAAAASLREYVRSS